MQIKNLALVLLARLFKDSNFSAVYFLVRNECNAFQAIENNYKNIVFIRVFLRCFNATCHLLNRRPASVQDQQFRPRCRWHIRRQPTQQKTPNNLCDFGTHSPSLQRIYELPPHTESRSLYVCVFFSVVLLARVCAICARRRRVHFLCVQRETHTHTQSMQRRGYQM